MHRGFTFNFRQQLNVSLSEGMKQGMVFSSDFFNTHEEVLFLNDPDVGLKAIIAIHSTLRGPAFGGCRIHPYDSIETALNDVLKLSKAMTYKAAINDLPLGGGKAVIIADPKCASKAQLLRSFAKRLHLLNGRYQTADDMGSTVMDMEMMREITPYARGIPMANGEASPATAYGVFCGIKAALNFRNGKYDPSQCSVAVQGVGSVGSRLCQYLVEDGVKVFASDIDKHAIQNVVNRFGVTPVEADEIYALDVDVFSPCAVGGILTECNIDQLKAKIVAGSANNQLHHHQCATLLHERGILYAPDYVISAGGLIDLYMEGDGYSVKRVLEKTESICDQLWRVFQIAQQKNCSPHCAAEEIVLTRLHNI